MIAAGAHLTDRANLNEFYTKDYEDHLNSAQANRDEARNGFVRADYIHLSFLRLRIDCAAPMRGGNGSSFAKTTYIRWMKRIRTATVSS